MVYNGLQNVTPLSPHEIKERIRTYEKKVSDPVRGISYDSLIKRFILHTGQNMKNYRIDQAKEVIVF